MSTHFLDGPEVSHKRFMRNQCQIVMCVLSDLLGMSDRLNGRINIVQTACDGSLSLPDTRSAEGSSQEELDALLILKQRIDAVIEQIYSLGPLLPKTAFLCPEQRRKSDKTQFQQQSF
ncbi:hypothetical protein ACDD71_000435 [Salmonella enterica]